MSVLTKKEVQDIWIEALSSGKYKQGYRQLGDKDGGFCCLGVLCQLAMDHGIIKSFDPQGAFLPHKVQEWAGLRSPTGRFAEISELSADLVRTNLANLNDVRRLLFREIADIIDTNRVSLFCE